MEWSITTVVLLKQLGDEDCLTEDLHQGLNGIMLGTDMEDCLVLVVAKLEELLWTVEELVFFEHGDVIVGQGVVDGQVAIVIWNIRSRSNLIYNVMLLIDANNVLYRLPLVVLTAACLEEFVVATEPIEDVFIAVSGTDKQRILTKVVPHLKRIIFLFSEDLEHIDVFILSGNKDGIMSLEVLEEASIGVEVVELPD